MRVVEFVSRLLESEPHAFPASAALGSDDFRRVLRTDKRTQLVTMSLLPGEDIGSEVHPDTDQAIFIVEGDGSAEVDGDAWPISGGSVVYVSAGMRHNVINNGAGSMKLFTLYAPPEHAPGTVHHTKADAASERKS